MERPEVPTCAELFLAFAKASATGFGGVLPFARRLIVEEQRWLSEEEFADLFAFCQFIPGANVVNLAICIGARFRGPAGAIAGALGMLAPPLLVVMLLGAFYMKFGNLPVMQGVLHGLGAAAAGLVVSVGLKMGQTFSAKAQYLFTAAAFGAIALWRIPLITMLAVMAPLSIGWQWMARRK
jgi:chromate transporter